MPALWFYLKMVVSLTFLRAQIWKFSILAPPAIKPSWPILECKHQIWASRLSPFDFPWDVVLLLEWWPNFSPRLNFKISNLHDPLFQNFIPYLRGLKKLAQFLYSLRHISVRDIFLSHSAQAPIQSQNADVSSVGSSWWLWSDYTFTVALGVMTFFLFRGKFWRGIDCWWFWSSENFTSLTVY